MGPGFGCSVVGRSQGLASGCASESRIVDGFCQPLLQLLQDLKRRRLSLQEIGDGRHDGEVRVMPQNLSSPADCLQYHQRVNVEGYC